MDGEVIPLDTNDVVDESPGASTSAKPFRRRTDPSRYLPSQDFDQDRPGFRRMVWSSWSEWKQVADALYLDELTDVRVRAALSVVDHWRIRGPLPMAVDATASIVEILAHDSDGPQPHRNRLALALTIARAVSGMTDKLQPLTGLAKSVANLAQELDLPPELSDIRHTTVHNALPTMAMLRFSAKRLLEYFKKHYWNPQAEMIDFEHIRHHRVKQILWDRYQDPSRLARALFWGRCYGSLEIATKALVPALVDAILTEPDWTGQWRSLIQGLSREGIPFLGIRIVEDIVSRPGGGEIGCRWIDSLTEIDFAGCFLADEAQELLPSQIKDAIGRALPVNLIAMYALRTKWGVNTPGRWAQKLLRKCGTWTGSDSFPGILSKEESVDGVDVLTKMKDVTSELLQVKTSVTLDDGARPSGGGWERVDLMQLRGSRIVKSWNLFEEEMKRATSAGHRQPPRKRIEEEAEFAKDPGIGPVIRASKRYKITAETRERLHMLMKRL